MTRWTAAALALAVALQVAFIATSSRPIGNVDAHGFTLFDDAMVSMRYARNLVEGHGLVWNPGEERVEGTTNLLWTLAMAAVHLLRLSETRIALAISAMGAACILATLLVLRCLGRDAEGSGSARDGALVLGALLVVGIDYPLAFWTLRGLEVGLLAFLIAAAILAARRSQDDPGPHAALSLALPLCAALCTRPDAIVPTVIVLTWSAFHATPGVRRGVVVPAAIACACTIAVLTVFRLAYYGEPLPNTVVLKVAGRPLADRIGFGAHAFVDHLRTHLGVTLLVIAAGVAAHRALFARPTLQLAALVFGGQVAYSIFAGGDSWEWMDFSNRFLAVATPELLLLASAAIVAVATRLRFRESAARRAFVVTAFACLVLVRNLGPATIWLRDGAFHVSDDATMAGFGLGLRECTRADARIAVVWAGTVPYFARRPCVDLLGKNDRVVARGPAVGRYQPGHDKWNAHHSIESLRPDVIAQTSIVWQEPGFWQIVGTAGYDRLPNGICVRRDSNLFERECLASLNAPNW